MSEQVQQAMLRELSLLISEGGRLSLFKLSTRALLNYSTAWRNLQHMERAGLVKVVRHTPPAPLDIEPLVVQLPLEGVIEQC